MADEPTSEGSGLIDQLKEAIRGSGQSLNQIGIASGVDASRLSRFMTGKRDLTLGAADKICRVLDCSPGELLARGETK